MNHNEFDLLCMGVSGGVVAGTWLGYQLRKIVTRVRAHGNGRPAKGEIEAVEMLSDWKRGHPATAKYIEHSARVMRDHQVIPIMSPALRYVPGKREFVRNETLAQETDISDRDEVIAALYGAGYKRAEAVAAVDACSLAERAGSIESWTRCALNHAYKAKAK